MAFSLKTNVMIQFFCKNFRTENAIINKFWAKNIKNYNIGLPNLGENMKNYNICPRYVEPR
jgi:hypothetical protein